MNNTTWNKEFLYTVLNQAVVDRQRGYSTKYGKLEARYIVYRMLQALYERQTADEKISGDTKHVNSRGLNSADGKSKMLLSIAKKSQAYKNLTVAQAAVVAPKLVKYVGQLVKAIEEKIEAKNGPIVQEMLFQEGKPAPANCLHCGAPKPDCDCYWDKQCQEYEAKQEALAFIGGL